jgi:hypothetical protein
MTINDLITKLNPFVVEDGQLPVYVEDGMDPSDQCEATRLEIKDAKQVMNLLTGQMNQVEPRRLVIKV